MQLVQNTLDRFVSSGQIAGYAARIMRSDEVLFEGHGGCANLEKKVPMADDTIFAIASMSKVITVAGIMQLYEQGLFKLWDPVSTYLPGFKHPSIARENADGSVEILPAKGEVTMRQLFTMTSGVPYAGKENAAARIRLEKEEEQMARGVSRPQTVDYCNWVGQLPLAFEPGQQWMYGFSIDVLGAVIEVLSGQTLGDYLKEHIFDPLGMQDTGFYVPREKLDRVATIYHIHDSMKPADRKVPTEKPLFEGGGGGLYSTVRDYSRFAQMLLHGGSLDGVRILGRKTIDLISTDHAQLGYPARVRVRSGCPCHDKPGDCGYQRFRRRMGLGRGFRQLVLCRPEGKPDLRVSHHQPARRSLPLHSQAHGLHVCFP